MLRLPLTALSIVCLILLSFWSIWRTTFAPFFVQPLVISPTVVVPTATMAVTPDPTSTPIPLHVATGTAALPPFQLVLPADWHYVNLPHERVRAQWRAAAQSQPFGDLTHLLDGWQGEQPLVVAWPTASAEQIGLIAYRAPRHDLTLAQYVADSTARLRAQPGVTVHEAAVNYTLHNEVPVAFLHYTLPSDQQEPESGTREGYQVVLFDEPGEQLLLLTFIGTEAKRDNAQVTTQAESEVALPALFQSIVRAVKR